MRNSHSTWPISLLLRVWVILCLWHQDAPRQVERRVMKSQWPWTLTYLIRERKTWLSYIMSVLIPVIVLKLQEKLKISYWLLDDKWVNHTAPIKLKCAKYCDNHCTISLVFINRNIIHSFTPDLRLSTLFSVHNVLSFSTWSSLTTWLFQNADPQKKGYNVLAKQWVNTCNPKISKSTCVSTGF